MRHEIKYPTQATYFIAYTDTTIFGYGVVNPDQVMDTGQPYLWTSLSESEWLKELLNVFNTIPEPPY
mgnify:FL=1|tara:strand:+ start:323 stop:523 length:201 start_codon:yes stop_codon:yes gene_type:complete